MTTTSRTRTRTERAFPDVPGKGARPLDTVSDLLAGLRLHDPTWSIRYRGDPSAVLDQLSEKEWIALVIGLGAIRARAEECEALASAEWFRRYDQPRQLWPD